MSQRLAIDGGIPVREELLPYGRQIVEEEDVDAVVEVLRSRFLTTGPAVAEFEAEVARAADAEHVVAVSNGTAALHAAMAAIGIGEGDEVIVPAMTFAASANAAVFQGGKPVFADVDPNTLLIDPESVEQRLSSRTRAVVAVDFAGQPCDYDALHDLLDPIGLPILADAAHSLGAADRGRRVGRLADMATFSFHPVKLVTTGEGGAICTQRSDLANAMRRFRNHGITTDFKAREEAGSWFYEMVDLGYNYRMTDFQAALGRRQLGRLDRWINMRQRLADYYDTALADTPGVTPLQRREDVHHAYHLYVVRLEPEVIAASRNEVFSALRAEGIGVNVHYIPVHLHPFYQERFGTRRGDCPVAESAYDTILTLPLFPAMSARDAEDVVAAVVKVIGAYQR